MKKKTTHSSFHSRFTKYASVIILILFFREIHTPTSLENVQKYIFYLDSNMQKTGINTRISVTCGVRKKSINLSVIFARQAYYQYFSFGFVGFYLFSRLSRYEETRNDRKSDMYSASDFDFR